MGVCGTSYYSFFPVIAVERHNVFFLKNAHFLEKRVFRNPEEIARIKSVFQIEGRLEVRRD